MKEARDRTRNDAISAKLLQTDKDSLNEIVRQVRKAEYAGTVFEEIPTCLGTMSPNSALRSAQDLIMSRIEILEDDKKILLLNPALK